MLHAALVSIQAAATKLSEDILIIQHRTARAVSRTRDASDVIVVGLTCSQAVALSRARARLQVLIHKLLAEYSNEADANARLLDTVASMHDVRQLPALFLRDVDSLPLVSC